MIEHWLSDGGRKPYRDQRTQCKNGHPYTEASTYWYTRNGETWRVCRICNKEKNKFRERLYGITKQRYLEMVAEQNGACAICGGPPGERALNVDHDHGTGQIRALLCTRCNIGMGGFRDSPNLLRKALAYLVSWKGEEHAPDGSV
jgi:hypothetical protein